MDDSVVLIDQEIGSFSEILNLNANVKSINVHCNNITNLKGLYHLTRLTHLDVSSNSITSMQGIKSLTSLQSLNLASNLITDVTCLAALKNLAYLNLSYNNIASLDGLCSLHGIESCLETLEVHGNELKNIANIVCNLQGIISLKHLTLHGNGKTQGYRAQLFQGLPQLKSVDYEDRQGNRIEPSLPGIASDFEEDWLESYLPEQDVTQKETSISNPSSLISTLSIDAVLSARKGKQHKQEKPLVKFLIPNKDSEESVSEDLDTSTAPPSDRKENHPPDTSSDSANFIPRRSKIPSFKVPQSRRKNVKPQSLKKPTTVKVITQKNLKPVNKKDDNTCLELLRNLESEREQRFKAEQANRRLITLMQDSQLENKEGKSLQVMAAQAADKLKNTLIQERKIDDQLKDEANENEKDIEALTSKLTSTENLADQRLTTIQTLKKSLGKFEADLTKIKSNHSKETQENHNIMKRLKQNNCNLAKKCQDYEGKIIKLQANLEAQNKGHKQAVSSMIHIESDEFKLLLKERMQQQSEKHSMVEGQIQAKLEESNFNLRQLENEFREALYIENKRFEEVAEKLQFSENHSQNLQKHLKDATEREQRSRALLSEMRSIVGEQKIRITELLKYKEETSKCFKERVEGLEREVENGRKKGVQLELVTQEKGRLLAQVTSLHSVVDGLKGERKLWSHELAQQGSSLAQDRGRMEMKIEALTTEVRSLKKSNERDLDALRIKSKVVEDQTDSIFKMKQALTNKDKEIEKRLEVEISEQRKLKDEIEFLTQENGMLKEDNSVLTERKQELKNEILQLDQEKENLQKDQDQLKTRWKEKGNILSKLESQVKQLGESGKKNVSQLHQEREHFKQTKQNLEEKMRDLLSEHQQQLKDCQISQQKEIESLLKNKNQEIQILETKIKCVEEEMREVLRESEKEKRVLEEKLRTIKSTFDQLQINIS